jgi:hypothetical protein
VQLGARRRQRLALERGTEHEVRGAADSMTVGGRCGSNRASHMARSKRPTEGASGENTSRAK